MSNTAIAKTGDDESDERRKHPLSRLTAEEIIQTRNILADNGFAEASVRFAYVGLEEPAKTDVLNHQPAASAGRRVRAVSIDMNNGLSQDIIISLTKSAVESAEPLDARVGQPPLTEREMASIDKIVKADPAWQDAVRRRGIDNLALVCTCPLSAGSYDIPGEAGHRLLRVLSFVQHRPDDHPWAHPIDGLVAYVDLTSAAVTQVLDTGLVPVPAEEGNYDRPPSGGYRTSAKPISIAQPEGASFEVLDDVVRWQNWGVRIGFDAREGLTLHQIEYTDGETTRPIIYRASIAEMVVPYGDPSPVRFWQNYFDTGEYLLGRQANSLVLGCDCLGEIYYLDAIVADDDCRPITIRNAICLHEEDYGVLWKHTDVFTGSSETRRQRRLVISFFTTIGNYDYGFYWYFYLDGTIEMEVKATGIVFTKAFTDGDKHASQLAPGLGAPYHQHLLCARLDVMVDGERNAVDEVEVVRIPMDPESNPYGNAFGRGVKRLTTELGARRLADQAVGREWHIVNPERKNRLGYPVAYALVPQPSPVLLADERSSIAGRATFATKHLWVTRYAPTERYPAGDLVNQSAARSGLPDYVADDASIDGHNIVLWHTFGLTHFPRLEDWPIMPVDRCGFRLRPVGFFDLNPTLDVPASAHVALDGCQCGSGSACICH